MTRGGVTTIRIRKMSTSCSSADSRENNFSSLLSIELLSLLQKDAILMTSDSSPEAKTASTQLRLLTMKPSSLITLSDQEPQKPTNSWSSVKVIAFDQVGQSTRPNLTASLKPLGLIVRAMTLATLSKSPIASIIIYSGGPSSSTSKRLQLPLRLPMSVSEYSSSPSLSANVKEIDISNYWPSKQTSQEWRQTS